MLPRELVESAAVISRQRLWTALLLLGLFVVASGLTPRRQPAGWVIELDPVEMR
jgi:hypothetical protein